MIIKGIEGNAYLINNDIYLEIESDDSVLLEGCDIIFYDVNERVQYKPIKTYAFRGKIRINISPVIKSYFNKPEHNTNYTTLNDIIMRSNWKVFNITFSAKKGNTTTTREINNKMFIRGGKRTYNSNMALSDPNLRTTDRLLVWNGYPAAEYVLSNIHGIIKRNIGSTPDSNIEKKRVRTCNPIYIKFLNSLGGYSNWLFEYWTDTESNSNLGVIQNNAKVTDLGNDINFNIIVQSKVHEEYLSLMNDLIVSPEIYLYKKNVQEWERLTSDNNKIDFFHKKRVYEIKLKFKKHYTYNPKTTW